MLCLSCFPPLLLLFFVCNIPDIMEECGPAFRLPFCPFIRTIPDIMEQERRAMAFFYGELELGFLAQLAACLPEKKRKKKEKTKEKKGKEKKKKRKQTFSFFGSFFCFQYRRQRGRRFEVLHLILCIPFPFPPPFSAFQNCPEASSRHEKTRPFGRVLPCILSYVCLFLLFVFLFLLSTYRYVR